MQKNEELKIPIVGYSVAADWYEGKTTDKVLLVLIGYDSNRGKQQDLISSIVEGSGHSVLVFDFSGMGDSTFELDDTRPAQHFLETIHAFDWLREKYPKADISVIGSSYGGYMAAVLTEYRKFSKLILRAPAIYVAEAFYDLQPNVHTEEGRQIRSATDDLKKHPLLTQASNFKGKTMVVAHGRDDLIPVELTDAYAKAFGADTYTQPEFTHSLGDPSNPEDKFEEYQQAIANWLNK